MLFNIFGYSKKQDELRAKFKKDLVLISNILTAIDEVSLLSGGRFLSANGIDISPMREEMVVRNLTDTSKTFFELKPNIWKLQEEFFENGENWKTEQLLVNQQELSRLSSSISALNLPFQIEGDSWIFSSSKHCLSDTHFKRHKYRTVDLHHIICPIEIFSWDMEHPYLISIKASNYDDDFKVYFEEKTDNDQWEKTDIYIYSPYKVFKYANDKLSVLDNIKAFLEERKLPLLDEKIAMLVDFLDQK